MSSKRPNFQKLDKILKKINNKGLNNKEIHMLDELSKKMSIGINDITMKEYEEDVQRKLGIYKPKPICETKYSSIYFETVGKICDAINSYPNLSLLEDGNLKFGTYPHSILKIVFDDDALMIKIIVNNPELIDYFTKNVHFNCTHEISTKNKEKYGNVECRLPRMIDGVIQYVVGTRRELICNTITQINIKIDFKLNDGIFNVSSILFNVNNICSFIICNVDKYYNSRKNYLKLCDGILPHMDKVPLEPYPHISRYLLDQIICKEICLFM
jgi:hypothetical protein